MIIRHERSGKYFESVASKRLMLLAFKVENFLKGSGKNDKGKTGKKMH